MELVMAILNTITCERIVHERRVAALALVVVWKVISTTRDCQGGA